MENFGYLFAAYTAIFAAIFGYIVFLWRRQAALDAEIRAIETRLGALKDGLAGEVAPPSGPRDK
ncbi:MAG TPA: CcmD family protein [Candidatus Binataceae bacterium]|nr:CcmD family protein [Candidatus Binataceae bacterium]